MNAKQAMFDVMMACPPTQLVRLSEELIAESAPRVEDQLRADLEAFSMLSPGEQDATMFDHDE